MSAASKWSRSHGGAIEAGGRSAAGKGGASRASGGLPILLAEGITVGYRPGEPILREVFLHLERGKVLAVIGPNGAGKTTLFRALSGELPLLDGRIRLTIEGEFPGSRQDLHRLSPRRRALYVTRVLQNEQPAWPVPVSDYVEAGLFASEGWFRRDAAGAGRVVAASLERMGIAGLAKRLVTELSGGEFRRVVIARALAQDPDILLLDEPTADLDLSHQLETLSTLRELARSGKAVAFSVHDLNLAAMIADEVVLIAEGRIAAQGKPAEVLTPGVIRAAYGARVIVEPHPSGSVPHIILDPEWLRAK